MLTTRDELTIKQQRFLSGEGGVNFYCNYMICRYSTNEYVIYRKDGYSSNLYMCGDNRLVQVDGTLKISKIALDTAYKFLDYCGLTDK